MVELTETVEKTLIFFGTASLVIGIFLIILNSSKIINSPSYYLSGVLTMIIGLLLLGYVVKKQINIWYPVGDFVGTALFTIGAYFIVLAAYNAVSPQATYYTMGGCFIFVGLILTGYVLYENWPITN
jgi:hypothetical protein